MKFPTLRGLIHRRILINFTADPKDVEKILPTPFQPKLYKDKAIVGICLIRLKNIRPKGLPAFLGISSENGAHRIAVEWHENGELKQGVFIPRRDTSSKLNALVGGRLFPGKHYSAKFNVREENNNYHLDFTSTDKTQISIDAKEVAELSTSSIFETLENVSTFFKEASLGYSPGNKKLDGVTLKTYTWQMKPLEVTQVKSSFFEDEKIFPKGSLQFDNALLMTNIEHEWQNAGEK